MSSDDNLSEIEAESLLWHTSNGKARDSTTIGLPKFILIISLILNVTFMTVAAFFWGESYQNATGSYLRGFSTDLISVRSEIEVVRYTFDGEVELDEHGHYHVDESSPSQQYVGPPSQKVDDAWTHLMDGLNLDLPISEAQDLQDSTYQWSDDGTYFTGLDVFHSLHCLNRLRQALFPDHYDVFDNPDDPSRIMHIGHCINHIRQSIQCHADLTPMNWVQKDKKIILTTNTPHTCRNFDRIRDWAKQRMTRFEEKEAVVNGSLFIVD